MTKLSIDKIAAMLSQVKTLMVHQEGLEKAFEQFCTDEKLKSDAISKVIENYLFSERKPLDDELINSLEEKPSLFQRDSIVVKVRKKLFDFIETFVEGMSGVV